jgi:hypothetical protein
LTAHGDDYGFGGDADSLVHFQVAGNQFVHDPLGPAVLEEGLADLRLTVPENVFQVFAKPVEVMVDQFDVEELLGGPPRGK